jgi:hemerythrin superfamily protein
VPDVIELLEQDHREVEQLFAEFELEKDPQERRLIVDKLIIELVRHSEAEETAVYPLIRRVIDNGGEIIEHEISEHSEAEKIMAKLDGMDPEDAQFVPLVEQLQLDVTGHVADEEQNVFPKFREKVGKDELDKLGTAVQLLKNVVPTRPHPSAPDHPPFNALIGPGVGLIDRVRDLISGRGMPCPRRPASRSQPLRPARDGVREPGSTRAGR